VPVAYFKLAPALEADHDGIQIKLSIGTLAWLPAIVQTNRLSSTGTAWLLLSILATLGIGFGIYHERVNSVQMIGIILAIVALVLLNHRG
jgi:drug/metabolite transporter (DMT)-like permease